MIVIDASALVDLLLRTRRGVRVADALRAAETLHAPHIIDLEVASALRRYATLGLLDSRRTQEALDDLTDLDLTRYAHDVLLQRIWGLRHNLTAYDAAYVALAEALHAPLLTSDARIAVARGHDAQVHVIR